MSSMQTVLDKKELKRVLTLLLFIRIGEKSLLVTGTMFSTMSEAGSLKSAAALGISIHSVMKVSL